MMKTKSYSVCINNSYYEEFKALYNSWKYYEHTIPLKVYIIDELDEWKLNIIKKVVEVVDIRNIIKENENFFKKYVFKWVALLEHGADYEIMVDADTIFLENIDYLFSHLEDEKLLVCDEGIFSNNAYNANYNFLQAELKKYMGKYADMFTKSLVLSNYNAGFLGVNKDKHSFLLKKGIEIAISDFDTTPNPITHIDQYLMNMLIELYDVDRIVLPRNEWMNTWGLHAVPKKMLKIENRKFKIIDEENNHIKFYHFTGGIGMPDTNNMVVACRLSNVAKTHPFSFDDVKRLWLELHETPVFLVWLYFYCMEII